MRYWKKWKYKHLTFILISIFLVFFLYKTEWFHSFLFSLGNYGYLGAFFAGILYISTYTVTTGALILLILAERLHPAELILFAGVGSVLGDFLIFKFVKDDLSGEIKRLYNQFGGKHLKHIFHTRYFAWLLPVIGALIIVSPFPDEIGVSLMGISRMKTSQFILIAAILDFIGVFLIVSASALIKP